MSVNKQLDNPFERAERIRLLEAEISFNANEINNSTILMDSGTRQSEFCVVEHFITLILSELYEAMEADRLGHRADFVTFLQLLDANNSRMDEINLTNEELHEILMQNRRKYVEIYYKYITRGCSFLIGGR